MAEHSVETGIIMWANRYMPGNTIMDQARTIEAGGVIDWPSFPDQMVNFIPPSLWKPENVPMAKFLPDPDSMQDATVMMALVHAAAPKLKLNFCSDADRKGPAEMYLMMLTMASVTEGRVRFQYGAGEIKNCNPYGHQRKQGLARLEDLIKISKAFWETDGPIDYAGNHWEMRQAYLGGAKTYRPEIWTMGTGPKQVEMTLTHCDGIAGSVLETWSTPEHAGTEIKKMKHTLVEKGRNPESFGFGAYCPVICHEDPAVVDRALDNPVIRWKAGIIGRVNPGNWREEGIEPATPEGWAYFSHFFPYGDTPGFVQEVVAKTTRKMSERSFLCGNPAEVTAQLREFVDAGLNWVCLVDYTPMVLEPADAAKSLERMSEICARLKGIKVATT